MGFFIQLFVTNPRRLRASPPRSRKRVYTLKRSFVYRSVTQFDTTNTSDDSAPFDEAESGVISGLVSFTGGGFRFDTPGVSLLLSGRGLAFQKNMVASNVTRWLRFETRVCIGNKQVRAFLQPQIHRKREAVKDQEGRAGEKERGLRGTKASSVEHIYTYICMIDNR
jgi:hypothetical protein